MSKQDDRMGRPLTDREKEVLRLVTEGLTNARIAQRMFISPLTVKHYMTSIFDKTGIRNRVILATHAADILKGDTP